ncbi:hypothetical protein MnTg03_01165 [bacterium MnTg03]|nr:hypothetical protein MnTg03_01165 [bacterium MnTg03]
MAICWSNILILLCSCTCASRVCCSALPVASAACTTRRLLCPPSRVRWNPLSLISCRSLVKGIPRSVSHSMLFLPAATVNETTSSSHRPTPAIIVSLMCCSTLSSGSNTAAIPPWAKKLEYCSVLDFANIATEVDVGRCRAVDSPAAPEPTITTSKLYCLLMLAPAPG